jgi:hypothetical protein
MFVLLLEENERHKFLFYYCRKMRDLNVCFINERHKCLFYYYRKTVDLPAPPLSVPRVNVKVNRVQVADDVRRLEFQMTGELKHDYTTRLCA